jgi:hypothetical protein
MLRTKGNDMTHDKAVFSPVAILMAWAKRAAARFRFWMRGKDANEALRDDLRELIDTICPSETPFSSTVGVSDEQSYEWRTGAISEGGILTIRVALQDSIDRGRDVRACKFALSEIASAIAQKGPSE